MEKYMCTLLCVTVALTTIQATTISTTSTTTTPHKNSVGIVTTKSDKATTTPKIITNKFNISSISPYYKYYKAAHVNIVEVVSIEIQDKAITPTNNKKPSKNGEGSVTTSQKGKPTTTSTTTYWGRSWGTLAFTNTDTTSTSTTSTSRGGEGGGGRVGSGSGGVYPSGEMTVNLDATGVVSGHIPGVSIVSGVTHRFGSKPCSRQAVFKVHFVKDRTLEHCVEDEKLYTMLYAQRMLKIQMYLSNGERSGFMFNIGDSRTNDGYSIANYGSKEFLFQMTEGDSGTQSYDAEVQGTSRDLAVYGNDHCPSTQDMHYNALEYPVSLANVWIRNKYLKMSNDYGFLRSNCSECLFGLNGQNDAQGQENEDIYIGANRVIFTGVNYRTGVGLCSMKLRWVSGPFQ